MRQRDVSQLADRMEAVWKGGTTQLQTGPPDLEGDRLRDPFSVRLRGPLKALGMLSSEPTTY